jgi:alanine racemase
MAEPALQMTLDAAALVANWRHLQASAGVPAAAAIKADGYGLGARAVASHLAAAGCRSFLVATWAEAAALGPIDHAVLVLHGFTAADAAAAAAMPWARPVLNTPLQAQAWRAAFAGRACDAMADTGMNRLGLRPHELAAIDGLAVNTLHSHLACADEPLHPLTLRQLAAFCALAAATPAVRHSLANSAGIAAGPAFAFDLVRPGIGLYGGSQRAGGALRPVVALAARVIAVAAVAAGDTVGYGAAWQAARASRIATINLGYADGIPRAAAGALRFAAGGAICAAVGRISMDLITVDVSDADVAEGDWLRLAVDLPGWAAAAGVSQYELLVGLGGRYARCWT